MSAIDHELQYLIRNAKGYEVNGLLNSLVQLNGLLSERKHMAGLISSDTRTEDIKELLEMNRYNICRLLGIEA